MMLGANNRPRHEIMRCHYCFAVFAFVILHLSIFDFDFYVQSAMVYNNIKIKTYPRFTHVTSRNIEAFLSLSVLVHHMGSLHTFSDKASYTLLCMREEDTKYI